MRIDVLENKYCGECQGYYPVLLEKAEDKWEKDGREFCANCAVIAFREVEKAEIIMEERKQ